MEEIWVVLEKYPAYEVSNFGNVRNATTKYLINTRKSQSKGDLMVSIKNGQSNNTTVTVKLLVYRAFNNISTNERLNLVFLDGNPENCRLDNLKRVKRPFSMSSNKQTPRKNLRIFNQEEYKRSKIVAITPEKEVLTFDNIYECSKAIQAHYLSIKRSIDQDTQVEEGPFKNWKFEIIS